MLNRETSLSLKLNALVNDTTRLLATWTIPHLDKHGVFHADAQIVKSLVFPLRQDLSTQEVSAMLDDMERVGLIRRFTASGRTWQVWPGFADNQKGLHAERERTDFPEPVEPAGPNPDAAGILPEVAGKSRQNTGGSRQVPEISGKSGPEVQVECEVEVEEEVECEGEARRGAPTPAAQPKRRISGFSVVHTDHVDTRVSAYMDILGQKQITESNAEAIMGRVSAENLAVWRDVLTVWAIGGDRGPYSPSNFGGLFERYDNEVNSRRIKSTIPASSFQGSGARGKPVMLPQVSTPTATEFAAAEERARQQRAERAARKAAFTEARP